MGNDEVAEGGASGAMNSRWDEEGKGSTEPEREEVEREKEGVVERVQGGR